jgi:hypothetical protein
MGNAQLLILIVQRVFPDENEETNQKTLTENSHHI